MQPHISPRAAGTPSQQSYQAAPQAPHHAGMAPPDYEPELYVEVEEYGSEYRPESHQVEQEVTAQDLLAAYIQGHPAAIAEYDHYIEGFGFTEAPLNQTVHQILVSGNTETAVALGVYLANRDEKVAILEYGYKQPELKETLKYSAKEGITHVLTKRSGLEPLVINARVYQPTKGLYVFPQGKHKLNWCEQSYRVAELTRAFRPKFHHIIVSVPNIIDTPNALSWAQVFPSQAIIHDSNAQEVEAIEQVFLEQEIFYI